MSKKEQVLISLNEAVEYLNELYLIDPEKMGRSFCGKQHLYNCISKKKLKRYGPKHIAMLDKHEVEIVLGPKKATG